MTAAPTRIIRPRTPARDPEPPEDRGRRRWAPWVFAAATVAVLLASAAVWLARERTDATAPRPARAPVATATPTPSGAAVERALEQHWSLILAGRYAEAYDAFAPALKAHLPRDGWIRAHEQDRLSRVVLEPRVELRGTTARATLVSMRTVATSGCFTWTGAYDLQRVGSAWRISGSKLTRHPCT